ncbi:type I restriction enzyme endonuclease domain-containing protein [Streptomyces mirabilis]|uniref:type I restriction enzyme endonuclease domain-containing protein n=1 Tax=Streptomyces mirabilis TaxID=68239 RepID=UPI00380CF575
MRQQYTSAELIAKLVEMAKEVMEDTRRGEKFEPPLDWRELAFYDAVADHGTARSVMGDEVLASIARELVAEVRSKLKPDWIAREPVRARLRSAIKRLLPPQLPAGPGSRGHQLGPEADGALRQ